MPADSVTSAMLLLHLAATWYLVGLCWLVQRVQYPLMRLVGPASFEAYEAGHVRRITPLVGPVMVVELLSGVALLLFCGVPFTSPVFVLGLALVVAIWISTFARQVPLHAILARGFDSEAHVALVRSNWIRTLAWTARGLIVTIVAFGWIGGRLP
jgi:hypothetical protein